MAKMGQIKLYYRDLKSFKKFFKKVAKKSVLLYFWSRSVDLYDFTVDTIWYKLGLEGQIILYHMGNYNMPYPERFKKYLLCSKLSRSL